MIGGGGAATLKAMPYGPAWVAESGQDVDIFEGCSGDGSNVITIGAS